MVNHPAQQLQILLVMTVFYVIYFDGWTRMILMRDNIMYGINDAFCIIQIYHFMCFTKFNPNYNNQYLMGNSMVINMSAMIAINIGAMIFKNLLDMRHKRKVDALKDRKIAWWEIEKKRREAAVRFDISFGMDEAIAHW